MISVLRAIDDRIKRNFTYRPDPASRDVWRSHRDDVLANRSWFGDCDDLGSTALDMAVRDYDVHPALLYRARVLAALGRQQGPFDHYVALASIAGNMVVFGDTYGPPCALSQTGHRLHSLARVSEGPDSWRLWSYS